MKFEKLFLWSWRNFVISALIFIMVFFYRNRTIKVLFEPIGLYDIVFYGVLIGIPLYLLISLFYTIVNKKKIKKRKKIKNKFDKFLLMNWRNAGILLIAWIIAVVIHNLSYAFFLGVLGIEFEEAVFFIIATIGIPLYFIISVFYNLIKKLKRSKK